MSETNTLESQPKRGRRAHNGPAPDEFCDDGTTRRLNRTKPYGVVYSDGWEETKFVQDNIGYRGDGIPVGYIPAAERGVPVVEPPIEEVLEENVSLKRQLEALTLRLEALERERKVEASDPPGAHKKSAARSS